MSITVGWNAAVEAGVSRERDGCVGACARTSGPWPPSTPVPSTTRSSRSRSSVETAPVRRSRSTSTPGVTRRWRRWPRCKPLHPEIDGFSITAGNAGRHQRRRRRAWSSPIARWPSRSAARPLADRAGMGVGRCRPGTNRAGADGRDPEGARSGGHRHRRRRPLGDQRGVRRRCASATTRVLGIDEDIVNVARQRLQPRPPHRHDRRPAW